MQAFEFYCPTKIVCGERSLEKLSDELQNLNVKHPLVITDESLVKMAVSNILTKVLDTAKIPYELFSDVPPDSSLDTVKNVTDYYTQCGCDGFIALGGGSVIDTAKGAAASLSQEGIDFATLQGSEILKKDLPPLIVVPTTAGTGSEVTLVAVIADTETHTKLSFTSYKLCPRVAILDPWLTTSLPPKLTVTTGMDALTHAIEAYTSIQKNPVSDAFACKAIELISENLVTACENGSNVDARCSMALASLMAGAAFSNAMVGIIHSIGHSLGGLCNIPHGQAMMLLLPHCIKFNIEHNLHREGIYGELLAILSPEHERSLGPDADGTERDKAFLEDLSALNDYFHTTYDIPITLSELNVSKEDFPAIAKQARYDGSALYNETEVTIEDVMEILEDAY